MHFHNFTSMFLFIAYFVTFFDSECIACKSRSDNEIIVEYVRYIDFIHTEVCNIHETKSIQDCKNYVVAIFYCCHNYIFS